MAPKRVQQLRTEERAHVAAVVLNHFDERYGRNETRLDMWQKLCRDVGVEVGSSIKKCKKNLQGIYLNIVDYVKAKEQGTTFRRFGSAKQLSSYIRNNKSKMFPREEAKKNPILRWMLIHLC